MFHTPTFVAVLRDYDMTDLFYFHYTRRARCKTLAMLRGDDMPFFIYGTDAKTGVVAKRTYSEAATEAEARAHAETLGLVVTNVIPCRPEQNPAVIASRALSPVVSQRPVAQSTMAAKENKEALDTFTQTLESVTPATYVTYTLIAINILVFVAMVIFGVSATSPKTDDLLKWGAEVGVYTVNGQWWRLFTAMFVHIGLMHLVFNMIAFAYVGRTVERMFGNVGFLVLYVVSGLGGGILAMYLDPLQTHAGASGAIFGVYGALLAMLLRERDTIPPQILAKLKRFVLAFISYNLIYSFNPRISMAAHIGGLITGFVCGLIAAQPLDGDVGNERTSHNMLLIVAGVALCVIGVLGMRAKYPNLDHLEAYIDHFGVIEKKTHDAFKLASDQNEQSQLTNEQFADSIDRDMLPAWRDTRTELDSLPAVDSTFVNTRVKYVRLRQESLEAMSSALHSNDEHRLKDAQEKEATADKMSPWTTEKKSDAG
jgi:rhomboid protease GluP